MSIKVIPSIVVSLLIGFVLGCIPVLNEHLHWNLWYLVPISGLILGALIGWIQFGICYRVNQKVAGVVIVVLAAAAMVGYAMVDYGTYFSTSITISEVEDIPDGEYRLRDLMTFWQYMRLNLSGSSISGPAGGQETEVGATWTRISYAADLAGALLGAIGALCYSSSRCPYCDRCGKYKELQDRNEILFEYEEDTVNEVFGKLGELKQRADYKGTVSYCRELAQKYEDNEGDVKIVVEQRVCRDCGQGTLLANVYRFGKKEWKEVDELSFSVSSETVEGESVEDGLV